MSYIHGSESIRTGAVFIGTGTNINGPSFLRGHDDVPITIGKHCAIGCNLCIQSKTHDINHANLNISLQDKHQFTSICTTKGPVVIGNNCWIGDNVCIMTGVTVGDGAVLGAGSVVTKDVPPFSISYGVPAKTAGYRFSRHIIQALLDIAWWNWDEQTISANRAFFELDLTKNPEADLRSLIVSI